MILFALSLLLPTAAGYVIIYREEILSPGEKLIFSFTVGTGLLSFYLFILGIWGIGFSIVSVAPFFVPFAVAAVIGRRRLWRGIKREREIQVSQNSLQKVFVYFFLILILWKLVYVVFIVSSVPTIFGDAYTLWNYKTKMLYYSGGNAGALLQGPFGHYPLNLPVMRAWVTLFMGHWSDTFANLHSVVLFICLLGLVFFTVRRQAGILVAVIFTYILAVLPILFNNVMSGYADMAVGYYYLAAVVMLYHWRRGGSRRLLVVAGIIISVAMFTKNEGIAIVFPGVLAVFLYCLSNPGMSRRYRIGAFSLFIASLLLIVFWLVRSGAVGAIISISGVKKGLFSFRPEGIKPLFDMLFMYGSYNLFWAGFLLILLIRWKKIFSSGALFFLVPSAISFCIILYVFLFTDNVAWLLNGTTINRTMLMIIPLLVVSSGFLAAGRDGSADSAGLAASRE